MKLTQIAIVHIRMQVVKGKRKKEKYKLITAETGTCPRRARLATLHLTRESQ